MRAAAVQGKTTSDRKETRPGRDAVAWPRLDFTATSGPSHGESLGWGAACINARSLDRENSASRVKL
jgi:hypothetical protein